MNDNDDDATITRTESVTTDEHSNVTSSVSNSATGRIDHLVQAHTTGPIVLGGIERD